MIDRISSRIFRVKVGGDGPTFTLKIAQFKHEIPALRQAVAAYSTLTASGFPHAPIFLGLVYEETKARTVGFLMEDISGAHPDIHNLRECTEIVQQLHAYGILHGDLNRYSFLITENGAKLIDFENATVHRDIDQAAAEEEIKGLAAQLEDESGIGKR